MTTHKNLFQTTPHHRRFDKATGKFIIDISYKTAPPKTTQRVIDVAEAFGLGLDSSRKYIIYDDVQLKITPTDIVHITGESGSGKSLLLRTLERDIKQNPQLGTAIDIKHIKPKPHTPIIETVGKNTNQALELLSRVGLNDAFLFLRTYSQLSDGQKYRYKIAKLIEANAQWWILDEFCTTLDRDTAKIVAYNLQKQARRLNKAIITATTHTDLLKDLHPTIHIRKKICKEITIQHHRNNPPKECSILREIHIEPSTTADYNKLAQFHYRSHHPGAIRKIFKAQRNTETIGVIVYTYPPTAAAGRSRVLPKMPINELNQKLSNISRVITHPKYRTTGIGQKLVKQTLTKCCTPNIETTAVMARHNPFFERAGMTQIHQATPPKQALAIQTVLSQLGFNAAILNSRKHVTTQLKHLTCTELETLRQAFVENAHPRYVKESQSQQPYGQQKQYQKEMQTANPEKLAKLINITATLLQTKIYLFWHDNEQLKDRLSQSS